jgi:hypothetical protein
LDAGVDQITVIAAYCLNALCVGRLPRKAEAIPEEKYSGATLIEDEEKYSGATLEELQKERKHLETLFADRINFYLVFAAGVLAFLFDEHHPKYGWREWRLLPSRWSPSR